MVQLHVPLVLLLRPFTNTTPPMTRAITRTTAIPPPTVAPIIDVGFDASENIYCYMY